MKRLLLAPVAGAFILVAVPASAQWSPYTETRRVAYDNGFREGMKEGEKDGRDRDPFEYRDEGDFRKGDAGYHRNFGDVERYRQSFRAGFADGYTQGYRRYGGGGGYGYGGYGGNYGNGRYGYYSPAFDNGMRDGFEKGRNDGRDHDRFDARRHKWYREGDRNYESRYGSRQQYEDEYRRGFLAGYEQGYRSANY